MIFPSINTMMRWELGCMTIVCNNIFIHMVSLQYEFEGDDYGRIPKSIFYNNICIYTAFFTSFSMSFPTRDTRISIWTKKQFLRSMYFFSYSLYLFPVKINCFYQSDKRCILEQWLQNKSKILVRKYFLQKLIKILH